MRPARAPMAAAAASGLALDIGMSPLESGVTKLNNMVALFKSTVEADFVDLAFFVPLGIEKVPLIALAILA